MSFAIPILQHCKYVDDVLFSGDDIPTMHKLFHQVNSLLARGGFHLRKWASNSESLLQIVPDGEHELALNRALGDQDALKVLGLVWSPSGDHFSFKTSEKVPSRPTKRSILSFLARHYDPLGWAAPVSIGAKILMQDLWIAQVQWDEQLPLALLQQWSRYASEFTTLETLRIPRWTGFSPRVAGFEFHGFADASSRVYSAVVYLRILHADDTFQTSLLTAKTKVAPVKTVSIPRLELLAVVLLTKLLEHVKASMKLGNALIFGWTDSTVVLAWIRQHPTRWSTFVANRVSDIQTRLPTIQWNHVPTASNPADCASRGISVAELQRHSLWWSGPAWLLQSSHSWPSSAPSSAEDQIIMESEARKVPVCQVSTKNEWSLPSRVSSWTKLLRVTAYIYRFIRFKFFQDVQMHVLVDADLREAQHILCRYAQKRYFLSEIACMRQGLPLKRSSPLWSLTPGFGDDQLLRLGGRLAHAQLPYERRYPIILPRSRITDLLIDAMHLRSLHGGTQLTLVLLRQAFWVIGARSAVKSRIHNCIPCMRERANAATQRMGDLPRARVNPSPPFSHSGVDYAGPFLILPAPGRGQKPRKYYVAVFVCLCTKAVHLEYVEDCTTPGFLAAFKRFSSRRGLPSDMYSDNGSNLRGAERELQRSFRAVFKEPSLGQLLRNEGITWHFIPALAPHFGGLWEAAVKSFKHHLRRVVGGHTLTQLEFSTLLCQIEACLNSRPLAPLKDDPSDLDALTPGHFLIGRPLLCVPEKSLLDDNLPRLSRWYRVQAMRNHLWKAWQADYLQTLHQRHKWQKTCPNLQVGELVLLRNNQLPPSKWELARVIAVHPGTDGLVRVVTLRTPRTTVKRPIAQVCRLPISPPTLG